MVSSNRIVVNTRVLRPPLTGVQRYASELLARIGSEVTSMRPNGLAEGATGHFWEQMVLPQQVGKSLLWSPSNTGPLSVERQVVTIHDVVPLDHPEWLNRTFSALYRFVVPRLVRKVRVVITISEFTRNRILEVIKLDPERVVVVPNGVDKRFSPCTMEEVDRVVTLLGIPSPHYVLALGSIEPRKNLTRLLEAWSRCSQELPEDVWLVLAGAKGKRLVFRDVNITRLPPRVYVAGHVPDEFLPELYSGALVFAYPSLYEGFGLPPLEAMSCGTATLTGNRTALPEVVGDSALVVDPYDTDALADGITRLVSDQGLREALSQQGRRRAAQFTWERSASRTLQILQSAASE